jgi:probable rRNA maturation factor
MPKPDKTGPDRRPKRGKKKTGKAKPPRQTPGFHVSPTHAPSVLVEDAGWRRVSRHVESLARRAAIAAGGAGTVVLSSDLAVRRLNSDHRARNKPTNVLTFDAMHSTAGFLGGDIILALGTVLREAASAGRHPADHMAHLVVHGALHLRGYDHHRAGDARRMEMAEARILHRLGVGNPWKRR